MKSSLSIAANMLLETVFRGVRVCVEVFKCGLECRGGRGSELEKYFFNFNISSINSNWLDVCSMCNST